MIQTELDSYIHHGWYVVPIHGVMLGRDGELKCTCGKLGCTSPGKHPTTPQGLKNATLRKDWISAWWKKWPWANVGIVTGRLSGVVVVDIDPRHGGNDALDDLFVKHGAFPETVEVMTGGGGRHFYFKSPAHDVKNSAGLIGAGIDVRGENGYVLAPPSEHISGNRYEWEASSEPSMVGLADMPSWLSDYLNKPAPAKDVHVHHGEPGQSSVIAEGGRDNFMTACAGAMRRWGMTHQAIVAALRADNEIRYSPPMEEHEIQRIAKSVMRYPQVKGM